jgi:hypothetical protein
MSVSRPLTATGELIETPGGVDPERWVAFVASVAVIPGGCHLWLGDLRGDGYGEFRARPPVEPDLALFDAQQPVRARRWGSHRWAWQAHHGPVPAGLVVMHECDEPLCTPVTAEVVALHLRTGTPGDNARARQARGRGGQLRYGLHRPGADVRGALGRSRALRWAVRDHLAKDQPRYELPDVVALVHDAGRPLGIGQLYLTDYLDTAGR